MSLVFYLIGPHHKSDASPYHQLIILHETLLKIQFFWKKPSKIN